MFIQFTSFSVASGARDSEKGR